MHPLFHIVYGTHANTTHHKLALDALRHLKSTDANGWQRLFLLHARLYLEGAEAPDEQFKDFENHVLHTRDGLWGGAPEKVRSWYGHVVEALARQDWPTAVYCAGVLSHYYTDPLQPFHTAQSEAENNIHRAVEWSIARSYGSLRELGARNFSGLAVETGEGPGWLVELTCRGAELANRHYEKLIAHYDIGRGVVDPPAGLDPVARRVVAEMIRYAHVSFAAILDRAFAEARVPAVEARLAGATLLAALQVPVRAIANRRANARERRAVERIYDELHATGTVERNLPDEERVVRDRYAREVLAKRPPAPQAAEVFPFKARERVVTRVDRERALRQQEALAGPAKVIPLRRPGEMVAAASIVPVAAASAHASNTTHQPMLFLVPKEPQQLPDAVGAATSAGAGQEAAAPAAEPVVPQEAAAPAPAPKRARSKAADKAEADELTLDHDIAEGPALGAKTVKRLRTLGIDTIRDLLKADAEVLAELLESRQVTAQTIGGWQDQALLMCAVPGLRAAPAQLLVGAGYRTAEAIATAEAEKLCADVAAFAVTPAGQRVLRQGDPPDIEAIKGWLEAARAVQAA